MKNESNKAAEEGELPALANMEEQQLKTIGCMDAWAADKNLPSYSAIYRLAIGYDEIIRRICFEYSAGGYNSEGLMVPKVADQKLRWVIEDVRETSAHQAIAADRAARLVANKAEVEPLGQIVNEPGRRENSIWYNGVPAHGTKLYATPTATTGASTADLQEKLDEYMTAAHNWASRAGDAEARALVGDEDILILHRQLAGEKLRADQGWERAEAKSRECLDLRERIAGSVGASTVLTDERVDWLAIKCGVETREVPQEFIRNFAREVAAQAGQVAVPEVVVEALDIALDLAMAEADNVHRTYAGYKPHKHEAVDRDVETVKRAIDVIHAPSPAKESK